MMQRFLFFILLAFQSFLSAQDIYRQSLYHGNRYYDAQDYKQATKNFLEATRRNPKGFGGQYNLSNALLKDKQLDLAILNYQRASQLATTPEEKSAALYNQGNAQLEKKDIKGAIESYRQALHHTPGNTAIIQNLQIAKKIQQKQEQQTRSDRQQKEQSSQKENSKNKTENQNQGGSPQTSPPDNEKKESNSKDQNSPQQPNDQQNNNHGAGGNSNENSDGAGSGKPEKTGSKLPKTLEQQLLNQIEEKERQTARRILNKSTNATYQSKEKDW